jgi:nucleoside-diphosphate-sugar epimerase
VGANLARRLLADGHQLDLLMRPGYRSWRIGEIERDARIHEAQLQDADGLSLLLGRLRPEWIFHLAAYGAYPSQQGIAQMIETNLLGTANLLNAAIDSGLEAFVNAGSSSEYGLKDHAPDEYEAIDPNSDYAVTKAAATNYVRNTARARGVKAITLRLYSAYGPYEEPTRLMPRLLVKGLQGQLPPLVDPEVARDYVYVDDVVEAFILVAANGEADACGVYNLASGRQTSLRELIEIAGQVLPIRATPRWGSMANRSWDTATWVGNSRRLQALGWRPRRDLRQGLTEMLGWYQAHEQLHRLYEDSVA